MAILDRYGEFDPITADSAAASNDRSFDPVAGRRFLTGIHALVRLPIDQVRADRAQGLNTSAFISGYPGSPLAGVDSELTRRRALLDGLGIVHCPAVNEELAMTAVMGSQQVGGWPTRRYDGVTGWWYGKAPGLERALDALHHANTAGSSATGGAVLFVGDDPAAKSSTVPSRSWGLLADLAVPVLTPGSPQEVIDIGRHAVALSRSSGLFVAMAVVTPVADGSSDVDVDPGRFVPVIPTPTFRGERWTARCEPRLLSTISLGLETEMVQVRIPAARRYLADNGFIDIVIDPPAPTVAIVAAGHTFRMVRDALTALGLDEAALAAGPARLVRLGAVWPLDPDALRHRLAGVREVIVVEDKRPFLELAVRDALYSSSDRPVVVASLDEAGAPLIPTDGWLTADRLVAPLASRLTGHLGVERMDLRAVDRAMRPHIPISIGGVSARTPWYCSGCPHTSSTRSPEGAVVGVGTGCHAMAIITQPDIPTFGIAQMGGEGAAWIGLSPFVDTPHAFQNLGDGTFAHSGEMAVRGAVSAGVNLTYKLLWNRAVAMTGGQAPVGGHDVVTVVERLISEGVRRIILTAVDPDAYRGVALPAAVEVWDRERLVEAQEVLAATPGVTVLVYDQQCAAELRRGRIRGRIPPAPRRVMIAERVCEGCGDCGAKSACLSVVPVRTAYGEKTAIHQTSCNDDESCLRGDCPSFITITGGAGRVVGAGVARGPAGLAGDLPAPDLPPIPPDGFTIRIPGIGGTGVVTVSQIIGAAAIHAGIHVVTLDHTGLSQKAGPVVSDIRLSGEPLMGANLAPAGTVGCFLVFDELVALAPANLAGCDMETTMAVVSTSQAPTGAMIVDRSLEAPGEDLMRGAIESAVARSTFVDSEAIVTAVTGSARTTNLFTLGVAAQSGAIPIPTADLEWAIEANGVAIQENLASFRAGRRWVVDPSSLDTRTPDPPRDPYEMRAADLADYGRRSILRRYRRLVDDVRRAEERARPGSRRLTDVVIVQFHRLLAIKDEYEVARLMLRPEVRAEARMIAGDGGRLTFHLHPPTLRAAGVGRKVAIDERVALPMFRALRAARRLRGTPLDPFTRTAHRRLERDLADRWEAMVRDLLGADLDDLAEIASLVEVVVGYESVKERSIGEYRAALVARGLERYAP